MSHTRARTVGTPRPWRRNLAGGIAAAMVLLPSPAFANGTPEQLVNGLLAFGGIPTGSSTVDGVPVGPLSNAPSVMTSSGMLDSPYYRSTVDDNWYPMTYDGYNPPDSATIPLSFGLGIGRDNGATTFHKNRFIAVSQTDNVRGTNDEESYISGVGVSTVDSSGNGVLASQAFTVTRTAGAPGRGTGTLQAVGHLSIGPNGSEQLVRITHTYTLAEDQNYLTAVSTFKNLSASPLENVNFSTTRRTVPASDGDSSKATRSERCARDRRTP